VLAAIRRGAGRGLLFLQSRAILRAAGRRLIRGIIVTETTPADLAYVRSRLNPGGSNPPSPPATEVTSLVAVHHGKITGFVQLVRHPPSHAPYVGYWLFSLYVLNLLYRGTGTGEALTRAVLDIARKEGAPEVFLVVNETNHPAVSLYSKLGFRRTILPDLEEKLEDEGRKTNKRRITMVKRFHE
jgi:ribosomal protein S18 acetylase RimI-like enzyme